MGFLKSFLAALAANKISEQKRTEQEKNKIERENIKTTQKLLKIQEDFYNYLIQINCRHANFVEIVSDADIDNDTVLPVDIIRTEQLYEMYKRQLKDYMSFGGDPVHIKGDCDSNKMDFYIGIIKRLKEYDWLDKQKIYIEYADDTDLLDMNWESERERRPTVTKILQLTSNEINKVIKRTNDNFIPYIEDMNNDVLTIEDVSFRSLPLSIPVSLKLTNKHILLYRNIYELDYTGITLCYNHDEIYYKSSINKYPIDVKLIGTLGADDSKDKTFFISIGDFNVGVQGEENYQNILNFIKEHNKVSFNQNIIEYKNINLLSGVEFERVCKQILEKMGFTVELTKTTGDGGIDLIAYNHQPLLSGKYIIQCKRYSGSVGEPIIRDLYGVITSERANKGILMTTGHFTKSAINFADGKPIELIDGDKLKELLTNYEINDQKVFDEDIKVEEVFKSNTMIEDEYDYYVNTIKKLALTNDERERAEFINKLLYWTLSEFSDINEFKYKLVIFKEIKTQIIQYLENPREEKSKYLSYLYQMVFVQISILQGNFIDALTMFSTLMSNKDLQFTCDETFDPIHTKTIVKDHMTAFYCMYYTYYDMCQMAALLEDEELLDNLIDDDKYYGYQVKSLTRIDGSIEYFKKQGEGREKFWLNELEAFNNMKKINCLYLISDYETKMYFNYTYNNGVIKPIALEQYNIFVKENSLVIRNMGVIENLQSKINNFKKNKSNL